MTADGRKVPWTNLRLRAFRDAHPRGQITTRINGEDPLTIIAEVADDAGILLARATARHTRNDFAVEDVETSAVSRALKFAGFVIDDDDLTPREEMEFPAAAAKAATRADLLARVHELRDAMTPGERTEVKAWLAQTDIGPVTRAKVPALVEVVEHLESILSERDDETDA